MKIINPSIEIMDNLERYTILKKIEICGRTCYKSQLGNNSGVFVQNLIKRGHESVLEHFSFSVNFIVDRGISHEIVRHRLSSFSQESTRYCNYLNDKFDNEITVIKPSFFEEGTHSMEVWEDTMRQLEQTYFNLLNIGHTPQEARTVLPNSLKTELVMTANIRQWRHFLKLRCAKDAHPQMREVAIMLHKELTAIVPELFEDIVY